LKKWIKSKGTRTRLSASPTTLSRRLPPTSTRCLLHAGHDVVPCIALLCLDLSWPQRSCPWLGLHNACLPFAAATPWLAAVPLLASCQCCCFASCLLLLLLAPLHACSAVVTNLHHVRQSRTTSSLHRCDSTSVGTPLDQPLPQAAGHPELYPRAAPCRAAPRHRMAPKRQAPLSSSSAASDLPPA
jgi:hypothetical protein